MGAIVGALYAEQMDASVVADKLWAYTKDPEFKACWEPFIEDTAMTEERGFFSEFRRSLQKKILTFKTFSSPSQQSAETLFEPLRKLFSTESIEELKLPFACVAVDLRGGEPRVFKRGYLVSAIYASGAIPGVFPPLPLGGELLIDGGGPYRVPVRVCHELGAEFVIAVDIPSFSPNKDEFKTGLDVLMRSDAIARNRLNQMILREADLVIRPDVGQFHWANFGAADEIRATGVEAMRAALPELRKALRARRSLSGRIGRTLRRAFFKESA